MKSILIASMLVSGLVFAAPAKTETTATKTTTATGTHATTTTTTNTDDAAFKTICTEMSSAWTKHDIKAFANWFADDANVINPVGQWAHGKAEIEKLLTTEHNGWAKTTTATFTFKNARYFTPNYAWVDLDQTLTGMMTPEGKTAPEQTFHISGLMNKKNDKWYVVEARVGTWITPPAPAKKM